MERGSHTSNMILAKYIPHLSRNPGNMRLQSRYSNGTIRLWPSVSVNHLKTQQQKPSFPAAHHYALKPIHFVHKTFAYITNYLMQKHNQIYDFCTLSRTNFRYFNLASNFRRRSCTSNLLLWLPLQPASSLLHPAFLERLTLFQFRTNLVVL